MMFYLVNNVVAGKSETLQSFKWKFDAEDFAFGKAEQLSRGSRPHSKTRRSNRFYYSDDGYIEVVEDREAIEAELKRRREKFARDYPEIARGIEG